MKTKHILINTLQLILLAAFFIIIIHVAENFTLFNVIKYSCLIFVITTLKEWLKNYVTKDLAANQNQMKMTTIKEHPDYQKKLYNLNNKVNNNIATQAEKDELIKLLYEDNHITQKQYDDYRSGKNTDSIIKIALIITGILLLGYLLQQKK